MAPKKKSNRLIKWLSKLTPNVAKQAEKYLPFVRIFRACHGTLRFGEAVNNFIDVGDTFNETIPAMRVMVGSFCDNITFISSFIGLVHVAGIAVNMIQSYQGIDALSKIGERLGDIGNTLEAQTALQARKDFADYIYDELWDRLKGTSRDGKCSHWYVVYHPDTLWYAHFNRRISETPLSKRFCGYTNCLDMAVIFMLAVRKKLDTEQRPAGRSIRTVKFHLLIPAYRELFIQEFLQFPEDLGSFVVEGAIHNSRHLVWLNIPEAQNRFLSRVENWKPPEAGFCERVGVFFGLRTPPPQNAKPRVLGGLLEEDGDDDSSSIAPSTLPTSSGSDDDEDDDDDGYPRHRQSNTDHSAEQSHRGRREHRGHWSRSRSKRRHHKRREIRNTRNHSRSSRGL